MLFWLKFKLRMWKATRQRDKFDDKVNKEAKDALKKDPNADVKQIYAENSQEFFHYSYIVDEAISDYWLGLADRLIVPRPDPKDKDHWTTNLLGKRMLSIKGIYELRKVVREERKDQDALLHPRLTMAFSLAAALFGLVTTIRGAFGGG